MAAVPGQEIVVQTRAACSLVTVTLTLLASHAAFAASTGVQEVTCAPGPNLLLARGGNVSACRIAAAAEFLVGPRAGNGSISCSAGAQVEFHRNGYLAFCDPSGAAGTYHTRGRRSTTCRSGSRLAFDDNGYLEYCS